MEATDPQPQTAADMSWLADKAHTIGDYVKAAASRAYADFLIELPDLALSPEEAELVKGATSDLVTVGLGRLGVGREPADALDRIALDACAVLSRIKAIKARAAEQVLVRNVARVFAIAQDVLLGLLSRAAAASL